jgi:hypothetical protein
MECRPDLAFKYCETLLGLSSDMQNQTPRDHDLIWVAHLKTVSESFDIERDPNCLPSSLALIHPRFRFKSGDSIRQQLPIGADQDFHTGINDSSPCEWKEVEGVACFFERGRSSGERCQADHMWPLSLGGPSIRENRRVLCAYHNLTKGNSITHFNWSYIPSWLPRMIRDIERLKFIA